MPFYLVCPNRIIPMWEIGNQIFTLIVIIINIRNILLVYFE